MKKFAQQVLELCSSICLSSLLNDIVPDDKVEGLHCFGTRTRYGSVILTLVYFPATVRLAHVPSPSVR